MGFWRDSLRIVGHHKYAYMALNLLYYGLVAVGMAYSLVNPEVQQGLMELVRGTFRPGGELWPVVQAYLSGNILLAAALTLAVNLFLGSFLVLTLPSLFVPFSGILLGLYRALLWGLLLAPQGVLAAPMVPHSLTLILEGQGYILAMLGAYVIGKGLLMPWVYGVRNPLRGYLIGLGQCIRLYPLVILVLAVAALYEAAEIILIVGTTPR